MGGIPGGIDTVIRGILKAAPPDIHIRVVGVTTDTRKRPVGRWTTCHLGKVAFEFFPVIHIRHSEKQARFPVTLRFLFALLRRRVDIVADVLEFHRIEPCLSFLRDKRPKTLVMHQNMNVLRKADSDIRWKYWPRLYFMLENLLLPQFASVFCVREDAAVDYRQRFPALSDRIRFTPTWVDTDTFRPAALAERAEGRRRLVAMSGFPEDPFLMVTVGRLDKQKNPLLLLEAYRVLRQSMRDARLLLIGDGVLRQQIEDRLKQHGLESEVRLCGAMPPADVARHLQSADLFLLSSAYEGMPISVLEALGSGLPVVSTDVGEVARVVHPGINGELVSIHEADPFAAAVSKARENIERYRGSPCTDAVREFTPAKVLKPIYENYRRLAAKAAVD
jgi:glycosyltransferase involved in cell wall biosynthesis